VKEHSKKWTERGEKGDITVPKNKVEKKERHGILENFLKSRKKRGPTEQWGKWKKKNRERNRVHQMKKAGRRSLTLKVSGKGFRRRTVSIKSTRR